MQMSISIHQTPRGVFDALPLEIERPRSEESPTRWKTIDVCKDVSITFFRAEETAPARCTCGRSGDMATWAHDTDCPQRRP